MEHDSQRYRVWRQRAAWAARRELQRSKVVRGLVRAQIRLQATLAVLDEALSVPIPRHAPLLHDRPRLPAAAEAEAVALEQAMREVTAQGEDLRRGAAVERMQFEEWERRATMALEEGRHDLARLATVRATEHQQHAEQLEDELCEYDALARAYHDTIDALRHQAKEGGV